MVEEEGDDGLGALLAGLFGAGVGGLLGHAAGRSHGYQDGYREGYARGRSDVTAPFEIERRA